MEAVAHFTLERVRESVPRARRIVGGLLGAFDGTAAGDDVLLAVSELCTNVVQHATGPSFLLRVELHDFQLAIEVVDRGSQRKSDGSENGHVPASHPEMPSRESIRGRGLAIVETLADDLEIHVRDDGGWMVRVECDLEHMSYAESA